MNTGITSESNHAYLLARSLRLMAKQLRGNRLTLQVIMDDASLEELRNIEAAAEDAIGRATQVRDLAHSKAKAQMVLKNVVGK